MAARSSTRPHSPRWSTSPRPRAYKPRWVYGLGLEETTINGQVAWGHRGHLDGFWSSMWYLPAYGVTIVVVANAEWCDPVAITAALAKVLLPAAATPVRHAGRHALGSAGELAPGNKRARRLPGSFRRSRPVAQPLASARREAIAAVDRLGAAGAERDLGLTAAGRASRSEHLPRAGREAATTAAGEAAAAATAAAEITALRLSGGPARGATARLAELTVSVELLLARAEDELPTAVLADEGLVRCVQRTLLARAASATRLSRREPLRGAIVQPQVSGAYRPVGRRVALMNDDGAG